MRVFIVVATITPPKVGEAITSLKLANYPLRSDAWLVASESTTRELAEKLGIRGGENGAGLVCLIEGYSGRLVKDAWEWLALHEAKSE
jgi:hypothetical protein